MEFERPSRDYFIAKNGKFYTNALFWQTKHLATEGSVQPIYTLKEFEHDGMASAYQIYMAEASDYDGGRALVGSYKHWKVLKEAPELKDTFAEWEEERLIREAANAKKTLIVEAADGNVTAAKELYGQIKTRHGRGRPSKEEVAGERKQAAERERKMQDYIKRIK